MKSCLAFGCIWWLRALRFVAGISAALLAGAACAQTYVYQSQFGATGPGQFSTPEEVEIDPVSHNILVAECGIGRSVKVFDSSGVFIRTIGTDGTGSGQFTCANGLAIDPTTRNVVAGDANAPVMRVQIFDSAGNFLSQFGSFGSGTGQFVAMQGIAIDPVSHNIIVVDSGNARIQIFDAAGTFLSQFGSLGAGNGQFGHPQGIAVDPASRNIVVVDQDNSRVQIFDSAGNYLSQFGSNGSGDGQFSLPVGVAIDPINHNIAVVDRNNNRVQIFDSTGNYLSQFGALGTGDGQFTTPIWAAIDPSSRKMVVIEGGAGQARAQIFALAGAVLPPTIAKAFGAGTIPVNTSTSLSFTIQNPNASTLSGVAFTDTFPAGLVIATPNGLSGSCGGGTITAAAGSGGVSLANATLAANSSCTFTVNVVPTTVTTYNNVTGNVSSTEGGSGGTASASLTATAAPAPPPVPAAPIPTLQEWALAMLSLMLLAAGGAVMRSRRNGRG